jgi:hypothetical protein
LAVAELKQVREAFDVLALAFKHPKSTSTAARSRWRTTRSAAAHTNPLQTYADDTDAVDRRTGTLEGTYAVALSAPADLQQLGDATISGRRFRSKARLSHKCGSLRRKRKRRRLLCGWA